MRESLGGKPKGGMKVKASLRWLKWDPESCVDVGAPSPHPDLLAKRVEEERTRWDPKDGELCLSRTKPEETVVEVRSGSDVQIDRQTWV